MAVITFSSADLLATMLIKESAWYPAVISDVEGPKKSESGKSLTYFGIFTITDGQYKGKELKIAYNTGTNSGSLLGNLQFQPAAKLCEVYAVVKKVSIETAGMTLDTDELKGCPVAINVVCTNMENGQLTNIITGFMSIDKFNSGAGKVAF